jgi:hypothetical protein
MLKQVRFISDISTDQIQRTVASSASFASFQGEVVLSIEESSLAMTALHFHLTRSFMGSMGESPRSGEANQRPLRRSKTGSTDFQRSKCKGHGQRWDFWVKGRDFRNATWLLLQLQRFSRVI